MQIFNKLAQLKIKKELKKWGLDEAQLNIDVSGISPQDLAKMQKQFKSLIQKHPALKKLKLDSVPDLLKHKKEIQKFLKDHQGEVQELLQTIKKK